MNPRLEYMKVAPKAMRSMHQFSESVREISIIEPSLIELVKLRASQINGCAYCIDIHYKDAKQNGDSEQRLYLLQTWRESPGYSERERAALDWTEAVTLVADGHVPDEVFQHARAHFSEEELVHLTLAIATINSWNRIAISFRPVPGTYKAPNSM